MDTGLLLVIGIALGLGFDLYAKAVCQGALLSRIDKAKLALGLLVCGVYQLIVLLVGYVLTIWLRGSYLADKGEALNPLISMIIFVVFAIITEPALRYSTILIEKIGRKIVGWIEKRRKAKIIK